MHWKGTRYHLAEEACGLYIDSFNHHVVAIVYTPVKEEELETFLSRINENIPFYWSPNMKNDYSLINPFTLRADSPKNAAAKINSYYARHIKRNPDFKLVVCGLFRDEFSKIGVRAYTL